MVVIVGCGSSFVAVVVAFSRCCWVPGWCVGVVRSFVFGLYPVGVNGVCLFRLVIVGVDGYVF